MVFVEGTSQIKFQKLSRRHNILHDSRMGSHHIRLQLHHMDMHRRKLVSSPFQLLQQRPRRQWPKRGRTGWFFNGQRKAVKNMVYFNF